MGSRGWMALAAVLFSGCAAGEFRRGRGTDAIVAAPNRESVARSTPRAAEVEVDLLAATGQEDGAAPARPARAADAVTRPVSLTTPAKVEATLPPGTPSVTVTVAVTGLALREPTSPAESVPAKLVVIPPASPRPPDPAPAASEPTPALPPLPTANVVASPPTSESLPDVASGPLPARSKGGRPVARVGDEVITLPELTSAVRSRLAELGPDASPGRREVIALARSTLKAMIIESLVGQEARARLGGPGAVEAARARIERAWSADGLPATLRREGVASEADLRTKLAVVLQSPESLREQFVVRSLADELMRLDGRASDFEAYLDVLRRRRPIESIMSPAELAVAGRKAALSGGGDR